MPLPIEDYGLIGDTQTAALVGKDGSLDWLCFPRFDSPACFSALLGRPEHGRWQLAPAVPVKAVRRRYRPGTLVLETEWDTAAGTVRLIDCMPPRGKTPDVVRMVEGLSGEVPMRMELVIRFDYGQVVPWVRRSGGDLYAVAGPDALVLRTPVPFRGQGLTTVAEFTAYAGQQVPFTLTWYPSHEPPPPALLAEREVDDTTAWWVEWSKRFTFQGHYREAVLRSLLTLKALTYGPTGGIVAAPTTSLPEQLGGVRNWDYRYCWLRDATLTLYSLMSAGYAEEAVAWRDWLVRAVAGDVSQLQIMYGAAGERRLEEYEAPWLPGYEGARPVRIGNAAVGQLQLDVYGEVMDALYQSRKLGNQATPVSWAVQRAMVEFLQKAWNEPDEGIWEVRGPRRHFTHSKVMAWVAVDRAVRSAEEFGLQGPLPAWRLLRERIHREVCARGFDREKGCFTQSYGSPELDASLLLIPLVGFLPASDPRVRGTVAAIERELLQDGFVRRYRTDESGEVDGLPAGEGAFLACSFWLADNYALAGRAGEARALFERLLSLRNDLGLLAEQYDPRARRQVGNFPQAFSHVALVNTAYNLNSAAGPSAQRASRDGDGEDEAAAEAEATPPAPP